jgi:hypothetical protein
MALNSDCRVPWKIIVTATALALGSSLTWSQTPSRSWEELAGSWCDLDAGCTRWWTLYTVEIVDGNRILIKYRDTQFYFFDGRIESDGKHIAKWTVDGTFKGKDVISGELAVKDETARKDLEDLFKRYKTVDLKNITPLVIKGIRKKDKTDASGMPDGAFEGTIVEGGAGQMDGAFKWDIVLKIKEETKGTLIESAPGPFVGTLTAQLLSSIRGIYTPPPAACSEAGRPRSKQDEFEKNARRTTPNYMTRFAVALETGKFRSKEELEQQKGRIDLEKAYGRTPGGGQARSVEASAKGSRKRSNEENDAQAHRLSAVPSREGALEADGEKRQQTGGLKAGNKSEQRAETHGQGKFMRSVKGVVSISSPYSITLELPALPVLSEKCLVKGEVAGRALRLRKQNEKAE